MKKMITLILVLCTVVSSVLNMAIPGFAASNACTSAVSVAVDTSGGQFYVVHGRNIPAKTKASGGRTDFKLQQGSLIKVTGTDGQYYKLDMNGTTRYVKKDSVRKAGNPFHGNIFFTTKQCPLRPVPYEGSTTETITKGTALIVVGKLINSKGNQWLMVFYKGGIHYIYANNVKQAEKVTLKVSASSHTLRTLGKMQMKATVSPSAINYTWSSSNPKVATVNIGGVVTGITAGNTTITASINGIVKASWDLTVTREVDLDVKPYFQTKDYTCSAASVLTVARYRGHMLNTKDTEIYHQNNANVGWIRDTLNKYLGEGTYRYGTAKSYSDYEEKIYKSLAQNSPVIVLSLIKNKYYNYNSPSHFTTVCGIYKDANGKTWAKMVDSYVNRSASNNYTNKDTGVVHIPLETLYNYGVQWGGVNLVYNP